MIGDLGVRDATELAGLVAKGEVTPDELPEEFEQLRIDSLRAEAYLAFLISQRQLFKSDLRSPRYVRDSYLGKLLEL